MATYMLLSWLSSFLNSYFVQILSWTLQTQPMAQRCIQTSPACLKTQAGKYKITLKKDKPLTYEMANPPYQIAHRKAWNSWNCGECFASCVCPVNTEQISFN